MGCRKVVFLSVSARKKTVPLCDSFAFPQRQTELLHGVFTAFPCVHFEFTEYLRLFSLKITLNLTNSFQILRYFEVIIQ